MISNSTIMGKNVTLGKNVSIWDFTTIRENVEIGNNVVIGKHVYIGPGVKIGNNVKIQNGALVYETAEIADGCFIGPGAILTNDKNPRSVKSTGNLKSESDWIKYGVKMMEGSSLGAGVICVAPVVIGKYSLVGAGSIVTQDTLNYSLIVGNPGKQVGWVGEEGFKLNKSQNVFICPKTNEKYEIFQSDKNERELRKIPKS
jgi:acetyltransferase-like isoleucine patch superfamily enzyme